MAGLSNYTAQAALNWITGKTAMPSLPTVYVALFTAVGTDAASGFTEVSGNAYARAATSGATWNAASGTAPSSASNASTITFPTATGSWGTVIAWGLYDASSAGNLLAWDYLGAVDWLPFSCSSASPGVLTVPGGASAFTLANGDSVVVDAEFGGTLPTLSAGSWTGLLTVAGLSGDTFNVGLNTTSTGAAMAKKVSAVAPGLGVVTSFAAGALVLKAA